VQCPLSIDLSMGKEICRRNRQRSGHSCAQSSLEGGVLACFFVLEM
jgi:hypothetical protein